jgi:hypothetical protein
MLAIVDCRVSLSDGVWKAACVCGKESGFSTKDNALKMLERQRCRYCMNRYQTMRGYQGSIYQNVDGKWCSKCSGCGSEQAYTRKDHAKQSELADRKCKKCIGLEKGFSNNLPVGDVLRLYRKFQKAAAARSIAWELSLEDFKAAFNGVCSLTGWSISMEYSVHTASLDRIDSKLGYCKDNVQWVHTMVNMCKNKYEQDKFIDMCKAVAATKS